MNDCPFCKIGKGEIPTNTIYEDNHTFAFLDKHPINPGHVLVIPKTHVPNFYELDEAIYTHLMIAVKKVAKQIKGSLRPQRVGLFIAGWDVPHTHVHVVPMNDYHDITSKSTLEGKRSEPSDEELANTAAKLKL